MSSFTTIDSLSLSTVTGGGNKQQPQPDAAAVYAKNVTTAANDTMNRAQRTVSAVQAGDYGTAARQGAATIVDGVHTVGAAVAPVGGLMANILGGAGGAKLAGG
jgi:hypothetical protein